MQAFARPISYDEVPYPDLCYTQTHPDRLATLAHLLGMSPAPVTACRVLELGCAGGGNLLPMAYSLPGSTFLGIDASARQIAAAQEAAQTLDLNNVRFETLDIRQIDASLGTFDYIIAHGVYSWVPPDVRDQLLAVCRANLAPQGVAYISYNTYPGWHLMGMMREMMLYHTRNEHEPLARARKARSLLEFLSENAARDRDTGYGVFLRTYAETVTKIFDRSLLNGDAALLHDELEEINDPIYFHQFAEHAAAHGLQYLVESDLPSSVPANFGQDVADFIAASTQNIIEAEQYLDFVQNRTLRRTLLCHQEVSLTRNVFNDALESLSVALLATPAGKASDHPNAQRYRGRDGSLFTTDHPLTQAALEVLSQIRPRPLPFARLVDRAEGRMLERGETFDAQTDRAVLAANLLKAFTYSTDLITLHSYLPPFVVTVSQRPVASAVARWQAQRDRLVPNLRHERVRLDSLGRWLLLQLDGTRTRDDLLETLVGYVAEGKLTLRQDGDAPKDLGAIRRKLADDVDVTLSWLARSALLVG